MMEAFLITGLPRSRTAWMAKAASIDGWSHCEHEVSLRVRSNEELLQWFVSREEYYAGVSDSHLSQVLPEILRDFEIKTLIVLRPVGEVAESLSRLELSSSGLGACIQGISECIGHRLVRTIWYSELGDVDRLAKELQWLMPGATVSKERLRDLQEQKVEADLERNGALWAGRDEQLKERMK